MQLKQLNERLNEVLEKQSNKIYVKNKLPPIVNSGDELMKKEL
jgi:hypothetical protein